MSRLGRVLLTSVFAGVVSALFVAPLIVKYDYAVLSPGDPVRHFKYPGIVEAIDERGQAAIRTFDGDLVYVAIEELREQ